MAIRKWTRDELLITFNLYCRIPFGKLHKNNPEIISLSQNIGRTPSAVAMKLVNFASFDPVQQARKVRGLSNASQADREIWNEFNNNSEKLAYESQKALVKFNKGHFLSDVPDLTRPTERTRIVRTRLIQGFFRDAVLTSYNYSCAICKFDFLEFLVASHIIPWSQNIERRADPKNGLCLCVMHDRAFDRGFITLDDSLKVLISKRTRIHPSQSQFYKEALVKIDGKPIILPTRFSPDLTALEYHREHIFIE